VSAGGNAGSALTLTDVSFLQKDGQRFTKKPLDMLFQEPIERAMASWRLVNETGKEVSLPLVVEYRLEGAVFGPDLEQKNMVMFKDGGLTIRVIARAAEVQPRGAPTNP